MELEGSSFSSALVSTLMIFFGVSTLSAPYAIAQAGVASLVWFLAIGGLYWFALILVIECMDADPTIKRYQQVAITAFGAPRGKLVTALLYIETGATLVGFLVSFGDIITYLVPGVHHHFRAWSTITLCVVLLPTTWTHSMSRIMYLSYGCAASLIVIIICVGVEATKGDIHARQLQIHTWSMVPRAIGIFSFGFGSAPVIPSIYASMANRLQIRLVMFWSFLAFIVIFGLFGVLGAAMFGNATRSIILLNLSRAAVVPKIAIWCSFIIPATKFTVLLCPITADINQFCRDRFSAHSTLATALASSLVVFSIMTTAILLPKFAGVIELVGACLDMILGVILPPVFYYKMFYSKLGCNRKYQILFLVVLGTAASITGTIASIRDLS